MVRIGSEIHDVTSDQQKWFAIMLVREGSTITSYPNCARWAVVLEIKITQFLQTQFVTFTKPKYIFKHCVDSHEKTIPNLQITCEQYVCTKRRSTISRARVTIWCSIAGSSCSTRKQQGSLPLCPTGSLPVIIFTAALSSSVSYVLTLACKTFPLTVPFFRLTIRKIRTKAKTTNMKV